MWCRPKLIAENAVRDLHKYCIKKYKSACILTWRSSRSCARKLRLLKWKVVESGNWMCWHTRHCKHTPGKPRHIIIIIIIIRFVKRQNVKRLQWRYLWTCCILHWNIQMNGWTTHGKVQERQFYVVNSSFNCLSTKCIHFREAGTIALPSDEYG